MRIFVLSIMCAFVCFLTGQKAMAAPQFYEISATSIDGQEVKLSEYKGKVVLIVNVASRCGFTRQYEGLQKLFSDYSGEGLVILGFPCNDFGQQEPGAEAEIKKFCSLNYGVTFPMFSKVKVVGPQKHQLYDFLVSSTGGEDVGWNFEKFLVDKNGSVVGRFDSNVKPSDQELIKAIEKAIG